MTKMPSTIWNATSKQMYDSPYGYSDQTTFLAEADALLSHFQESQVRAALGLTLDDRSRKKAIRMLQIDAADALMDCTFLLRQKRPNAASRLFRDVFETLDLAAHFGRDTSESRADLEKWFANEIVSHRHSRASAEAVLGQDISSAMNDRYRDLSRFTHRTYEVLLQSYGLAGEDKIWHEAILSEHLRPNGSVIPQILAQYLPVVANLIFMYIEHCIGLGTLSESEVKAVVIKVLGEWSILPIQAPNAENQHGA
jgi:hypothetical protein